MRIINTIICLKNKMKTLVGTLTRNPSFVTYNVFIEQKQLNAVSTVRIISKVTELFMESAAFHFKVFFQHGFGDSLKASSMHV